MNTNELVSVIIPVYNHANTIGGAILSFIKQNYRPIEIIIVDDGSSDNLTQVIETVRPEAEAEHIPIKFIRQINSGAPVARNTGFNNSSGSYVIFADADTIANPDMIKKLYNRLITSGCSYAYSAFKYGWKIFKSKPFERNELKKNNYIDVSALIKRDDFPGFDPELKKFQDWDLWLTLLEKNKIGAYVSEVLYKKLIKGRKGMSLWLPSFVYRLPFKIKAVRDYEIRRAIVLKKHDLG